MDFALCFGDRINRFILKLLQEIDSEGNLRSLSQAATHLPV